MYKGILLVLFFLALSTVQQIPQQISIGEESAIPQVQELQAPPQQEAQTQLPDETELEAELA